MRSKLLIISALLLTLTFVSCKTTEKNYKSAYDVAKGDSSQSTDPAISKLIQEEQRGTETVINGDSVRVKVEYTLPVESVSTKLPKCGVVIGSFKQIFNANSLCTRLKDKGYPAYVLKNKDNQYYVVAKGFDQVSDAAEYLKQMKKKMPFTIPIEPFIISNPR